MKTNIVLCLTALAALSACGSMAQLSQAPTQRFRDGIYYKPQTEETVAAPVADSEVANLVEETKGSQIFLHSGQNDTLFIPENKAVSFKFNPQEGNTTVTVFDTPDYYWNYSWAYRPWYLSSWWDPCETFGKNITSGVVTKENADSKTSEWQDLVNSSMN